MIPRGLRFDGAAVGAESEAVRSEHVSIRKFTKKNKNNRNVSKIIKPLFGRSAFIR